MIKDIEKPLVSVAVITYNQKNYLRECIESILAQDYQNIEIVVADDGSTDGTQTMLLEYEEKYPNKFILKLSKKNQGITANSNLAHFACNGKYIAWMGGDDLMFSCKISTQVDMMERNCNAVICYHDLDVFNSETGETLHIFSKIHKPREGNIQKAVKYGVFNGACSTMVRRSATPKIGFDSRIPIASDWLYWVQSLYNGGEIIYIDRIMGKYRRHNNNITRQDGIGIIKNIQDHLVSTVYILSERPDLIKEVKYRQSQLIRTLGTYYPKNKYKQFLRASLRLRFNLRTLKALIMHYCDL